MLERVGGLSSSAEGEDEYQCELIRRLKLDGCNVPSFGSGERVSATMGAKPFVLWLPLGYHPWWYKKVKKALWRLNRDASVSVLLDRLFVNGLPSVKVAWKNMLPSTDKLLQLGWRLGSAWKERSSSEL